MVLMSDANQHREVSPMLRYYSVESASVSGWLDIGSVFYTATEVDAGEGLGISQVLGLANLTHVPAIAIGGIDPYRAESLVTVLVVGIEIMPANDPRVMAEPIHSSSASG